MLSTKVIKLIVQLPPKEVKEFWKYALKQHPSKELSHQLVLYLKKYYPNFNESNLDYRKVLKFLKKENLSKKQLQNKYSKLYEELRRFLWTKGFDKSSTEVNFYLLKYFKEHGLDEAFDQELRNTNKKIELQEQSDIWYWSQKQKINHEAYYNLGTEKVQTNSIGLFSALTDLNEFHAISKLMYACELYSRANVLNTQPKAIQFLSEIEQHDYSKQSQLHHIYQLALRMIRHHDDQSFESIKTILLGQKAVLSKDQEHIFYSYLINHCIFHVRRGDISYLNEIFIIYRTAIENESLISGGYFNKDHFLNIIDIICQLKKFDWVKKFIWTNGNKLPPSLQESFSKYGLGFVAFQQNEFNLCKDLIHGIQSKNPFFELRVRWLQLVNQYEIDPYNEQIFGMIKNLRQFVRRKSILRDKYKKSVLLSLKMIDKMSDPNYNKTKLTKEFDEKKSFYYGSWIKKKLKQLKGVPS